MTFHHLHDAIITLARDCHGVPFNDNGLFAQRDQIDVNGLEVRRVFQPFELFGRLGLALLRIRKSQQIAGFHYLSVACNPPAPMGNISEMRSDNNETYAMEASTQIYTTA